MGPCTLCESTSVVVINSSPYCIEHLDDGFRAEFRAVAIIRGVTDDDELDSIEARGIQMFNEMQESPWRRSS